MFLICFSTDKPNELELPCPVQKSKDRKKRQGKLQQQQQVGTTTQISGVKKVTITSNISGGSCCGVNTDQEELLSKVRHTAADGAGGTVCR